MEKERRKHPRLRLAEETVFVIDPCSGKVARLSDLSGGGMQMRYAPREFSCHGWTRVNLFTTGRNPLLISALDCKAIYDIAGLMENGSYSGMDVRFCGFCFDRLTDSQKAGLEKLLESVATA